MRAQRAGVMWAMRSAGVRRWAAAGVAVLALAAACFSERAGVTGPPVGDCDLALGDDDLGKEQVIVAIRGFAFAPAEVRVRPGTRVVWVNCETSTTEPHTTTSDDGVWNSPLLQRGDRFTVTFDAAGSYPYHCMPHPSMRGVVVVDDA